MTSTHLGPAHTQSKSREQLWELIQDVRFAMFTTRASAGELCSRPMTIQNHLLDEDNCLWFFMSRSSDPVAELGHDCNVNVSWAHPGKDIYVSVSGSARVVENTALKNNLWSKMAEAWFPGGVDDPDLALVEVKMSKAHYWSVKENKITQLFELITAAVTGRAPSQMGETGDVRLTSSHATMPRQP